MRYGGNTSCVEVRSAAGALAVLDCGTGARELGLSLLAEADPPTEGSLLISHTHWDHIQGLPFFAPLFAADHTWRVHGPRGLGQSLGQTLSGQMQYVYFPVAVDQLSAEVSFHDLVEGELSVGDIRVTTQYVNHPALTLAYRLEVDGAVVVYATDHEPYDRSLAQGGGDVLASRGDARHVAFLRGADLVLHDAQYLTEDYAHKAGWGHSTVEYVVDVARLAGVRALLLFHHDPSRHDQALDALLAHARAYAAATGFTGSVDAAAEGLVLDLVGSPERSRVRLSGSATREPALLDLSRSVYLDSDDVELRTAVSAAAEAEQLAVLLGPEAAAADPQHTVLVVDTDRTEGDQGALRTLLSRAAAAGSSVIGLSRQRTGTAIDDLVTDWLVWPTSAGHLRTKLRAAVLRRACRWESAPLPPDEQRRLEALRSLDLLDTGAEERFDRLTERACEALDVPIALVTLVDEDRQWFKSRQGVEDRQTPRDQSICAHAILTPDLFEVHDLLEDDRFADNPATVGGLRYYAGVPLTTEDGSRVGMLCVADQRPRTLSAEEVDQLRTLAGQVEQELRQHP